MNKLRTGARQRLHLVRQLNHGEFSRVAEVHWASDGVVAVHQAHEAFDQVIDVAEGARLGAVAIEGDGLVAQRLDDEVGHHTTVVGVHARTVGVEDTRHLNVYAVLAVVVEEEGLGATLAFVVAGARADGVDVPDIGLRLRVDLWVAIHLAGRGLEDLRLGSLGEPEHVDSAVDAGLGGLHRVELVVDG